jgi:hypothetical protein
LYCHVGGSKTSLYKIKTISFSSLILNKENSLSLIVKAFIKSFISDAGLSLATFLINLALLIYY